MREEVRVEVRRHHEVGAGVAARRARVREEQRRVHLPEDDGDHREDDDGCGQRRHPARRPSPGRARGRRRSVRDVEAACRGGARLGAQWIAPLDVARRATTAIRLKDAWATMFMPSRPVRWLTKARTIPKIASPANWYSSQCASPKMIPSTATAKPTPTARRRDGPGRGGVKRRASALNTKPRNSTSSKKGAPTTVRIAMTAKPQPCEAPTSRCVGAVKCFKCLTNGAYSASRMIWPPTPMPMPARSTSLKRTPRSAKNLPVPRTLLAIQGPRKKPTHSPTSDVPTNHSGGSDIVWIACRRLQSPAAMAATMTKMVPTTWPMTNPATPIRSQNQASLRVEGGAPGRSRNGT